MPKVTLYQKLRTAKKKYCEGKIDKTAFNSAADPFVQSTVLLVRLIKPVR